MEADLHTRRDGWRMYTVRDPVAKKCWMVHHHHSLRDKWNIQNRFGHSINEYGKLGEKIVAACEARFAELEAV